MRKRNPYNRIGSNGVITVGTDPIIWVAFSQTYPLSMGNGGTGASLTPTVNNLVYSTASNLALLATANSGVLVTSAGGVPSISTSLPAGLTIPGYALAGANADITSMSGLTGPLRAPTSILDANGNEIMIFTGVASAVNEITFTNAISGATPRITSSGGDTNIDMLISTKGTGRMGFYSASTTNPITWLSGTSYQHQTNWLVSNTAAVRNVTLQDADGTFAYLADRGWVLVSTATASNVASVDFTNLATYNNYCLVYQNASPVTNATVFAIQASINNGVSYLFGASDNIYQVWAATNTASSTSSGTTNYVPLAATVTNLAGGGAFGQAFIGNVLQATKKGVTAQSSFYGAASPPSG